MKTERYINLPYYEFGVIRALINSYSGIFFEDRDLKILEQKLQKRLIELEITSFREYISLLKYNRRKEEEFESLLNLVTINETYFFRENFQLKAFKEEILPEYIKERKSKGYSTINIWSAGCSSGEEPYSIAIILKELGLDADWNINIIGNDINSAVLQKARTGIYTTASFRTTDDYYRKKYFEKIDENHYKIRDDIRQMVTFLKLNLMYSSKIPLLPTFDFVFCRNVIIYFDMESRRKLIDTFYDKLANNGYLFLGHSETLINISTKLLVETLKNDLVYKKSKEVL